MQNKGKIIFILIILAVFKNSVTVDEEEISDLLICKEKCNLIIKQCYVIVWSAEKLQTVKPQNF